MLAVAPGDICIAVIVSEREKVWRVRKGYYGAQPAMYDIIVCRTYPFARLCPIISKNDAPEALGLDVVDDSDCSFPLF